MSNLKKIAPATYELPQIGGMRVPGLLIASEAMLQDPDLEEPMQQVRNVAHLPGIVGYSIAMPDIHWGYGFAIGGVAAMDAESGVISPGGVGYDINCGVRLAVAPEMMAKISEDLGKKLLKTIFDLVPSGVGRGRRRIHGLSNQDYTDLLQMGAKWSIDRGLGYAEDLDHMESNGRIDDADPSIISLTAKERGKDQLGSIGSGNHFVEIGEVQQIYLPDIAKAWGIQEGQIYILIHSGSRGFGHQVCQDNLDIFMKAGFAEGLPDKQLVAAPIHSSHGKSYFHGMAAAANFAFNNRQQILHGVRMGFKEILGTSPKEVRLIYDVCHNIAKFEMHEVNGKKMRLCVHRKGATRAYGKGSEELSPLFRKTGQPVLVPGDMGRASHLMVGLSNPLTWCSSCHGAGRARSRVKSSKAWKGIDIYGHMKKEGVDVMASSYRTVAEEMPDAYKNVDMVVDIVQEARLADKVARLKPRYVMKG